MRTLAVAAAAVLLAPAPAIAADPAGVPPVGAPSGFYFGGHVGYGFGNATATLADPTGVATAGGTTQYGMLFGGVQGGYQQTLPSRWMWGVELDMSFPNYMDTQDTLSYRATSTGTANEQLEFLGTFRGRLGYAMGTWTPFVTGGVAFANTRYARDSLTIDNEDTLPGPVWSGATASYTKNSSQELIWFIAQNLGSPAPSSQTVVADVFVCPGYLRRAPGVSSMVGRKCYLLNDDVDPNPLNRVPPFGYPLAPVLNPLKLSAFDSYVPPSSIYAITDVDKGNVNPTVSFTCTWLMPASTYSTGSSTVMILRSGRLM